ncbi:MAG: hypothetical protein QW728_00625, partial [Thermoplasmata archaeon]
ENLVSRLQRDTERIKQEFENRMQELEAAQLEFEQDSLEFRARYDDLIEREAQVASFKTEKEMFEKRQAEAKTELQEIQELLSAKENELRTLEDKLKKQQSELAQKERYLNTQKEELLKIESDLKTKQNLLDKTESKINLMMEEITKRQKILEESEASLDSTRKQIHNEIAQAVRTKSRLEQENQALQKALDEKKEAFEQYKKSQLDIIAREKAEVEALRKETDNYKKELDSYKDSLEAKKKEIALREEASDNYRLELQKKEMSLKEIENEQNRQKEKIERRDMELKEWAESIAQKEIHLQTMEAIIERCPFCSAADMLEKLRSKIAEFEKGGYDVSSFKSGIEYIDRLIEEGEFDRAADNLRQLSYNIRQMEVQKQKDDINFHLAKLAASMHVSQVIPGAVMEIFEEKRVRILGLINAGKMILARQSIKELEEFAQMQIDARTAISQALQTTAHLITTAKALSVDVKRFEEEMETIGKEATESIKQEDLERIVEKAQNLLADASEIMDTHAAIPKKEIEEMQKAKEALDKLKMEKDKIALQASYSIAGKDEESVRKEVKETLIAALIKSLHDAGLHLGFETVKDIDHVPEMVTKRLKEFKEAYEKLILYTDWAHRENNQMLLNRVNDALQAIEDKKFLKCKEIIAEIEKGLQSADAAAGSSASTASTIGSPETVSSSSLHEEPPAPPDEISGQTSSNAEKNLPPVSTPASYQPSASLTTINPTINPSHAPSSPQYNFTPEPDNMEFPSQIPLYSVSSGEITQGSSGRVIGTTPPSATSVVSSTLTEQGLEQNQTLQTDGIMETSTVVCGLCRQLVYAHHSRLLCSCGEVFHSICVKSDTRCPVCYTPASNMKRV